MSTPPNERPRLPDTEKPAEGEVPDLDRAYEGRDRSRIPEEDKDRRIPDPEE